MLRFMGAIQPAFVPPVATAGAAAAPVLPWSLLYDGVNDEVDCGDDASIMDLTNAGMTADVYWKCPPLDQLGNYANCALISQGDPVSWGGSEGWCIYMGVGLRPGGAFSFSLWELIPTPFNRTAMAGFTLVEGAWYYSRARYQGPGGGLFISVDAGAEGGSATWGTPITSAFHLYHGRRGGSQPSTLIGGICYSHIWNVDKGPLGAVPAAPFPVDANTMGRWIHSDGAGAVLTDTSGNGNHGAISGAAWSATVPAGWTI
jgi:hypothetical protein